METISEATLAKIKKILPFSIIFLLLGLFIVVIYSSFLGYQEGSTIRNSQSTTVANAALEQEYQRALVDMEAGNYYIAIQRFEYIYSQDDTYKLALDKWVEIQFIMNTTATPTLAPPEPTFTPTPDGRPKEDLYNLALSYTQNKNWQLALETLSGLRNSDPFYRVTEVDGLIYLALRNRGAIKILEQGRLEEGLYDFSLAEQFGPIDLEAENYRGWARLYLQGNGFWMAYPEIAAYYYGQLAGMVPHLKDTSGMTAFYRYWASLVQYAEKLAKEEDWCASFQGYENANAAAVLGENLQATAIAVQENCFSLTPSLTPTITETTTITGTLATSTVTLTPTVTSTGFFVTETVTPTPTTTQTPTITSPNTQTPTPTTTPTHTLTPTPTPTPTNTPDGD